MPRELTLKLECVLEGPVSPCRYVNYDGCLDLPKLLAVVRILAAVLRTRPCRAPSDAAVQPQQPRHRVPRRWRGLRIGSVERHPCALAADGVVHGPLRRGLGPPGGLRPSPSEDPREADLKRGARSPAGRRSPWGTCDPRCARRCRPHRSVWRGPHPMWRPKPSASPILAAEVRPTCRLDAVRTGVFDSQHSSNQLSPMLPRGHCSAILSAILRVGEEVQHRGAHGGQAALLHPTSQSH